MPMSGILRRPPVRVTVPHRPRTLPLLAAAILLTLPPVPGARPLAAQEPTGAIVGVVTDTAAAPLAGAIVSVLSSERRAESNAAGRFELAGLAAGRHLVAVRKLGYLPLHFEITLGAGERTSLRLRLEPAPQELEAVRVEADRIAQRLPRIAERRDKGQGRIVTGAQLMEFAKHMPNVRDAIDWMPGLNFPVPRAASGCDVYVDARKIPKEQIEGEVHLEFWVDFDEIEAVEVHRDRYQIVDALMDHEFGDPMKRDTCVVLIWTKYIHLRPGRHDAGFEEDPAVKARRELGARLAREQRARERADTTARPTGTLTGFVVDPEQRPLAGVTITLPGATGRPGQSLRAVTDSTGAFTIADVPVGLVVIRAERKGCAAVLADAVIEAGERAVRVVTMCVADRDETTWSVAVADPPPRVVRRAGDYDSRGVRSMRQRTRYGTSFSSSTVPHA
jgi:hypothetical protein